MGYFSGAVKLFIFTEKPFN